jgi:hypothetical protein
MVELNFPTIRSILHYYYSSSGHIFTSKVEALLHEKKTGEKIYLYYNDDIYDKLDWTIEPPHSLDYYYKEQAQKIRDEYDYVILFYSGGYDSTNILETFHFNGLKFDKIVVVGALGQDSHSGVDENMNGEAYLNAFPYLKELGLDSIVQVCDYSQYFNSLDNFSITSYGAEWIHEVGSQYSPHHWFWRDVHKFVVPAKYRDSKVALLFGIDKPIINVVNEKMAFRFNEVAFTAYGNVYQPSNIEKIHFYWDPNNTNILLKQLHVVSRAFMHNRPKNNDEMDDLANKIVYNLKRPLKFKSPKGYHKLLSHRDNFLLNHKDSDIYKLYQNGLNLLDKQIGLNNRIKVFSKYYFI